MDNMFGDLLVDIPEDEGGQDFQQNISAAGMNHEQDDLDTIYEEDEIISDSPNRDPADWSEENDDQDGSDFSDSNSFIKSVISEYDPEKEKLLLEKIDEFLKSDQPKTYNQFQRVRQTKLDEVEFEFQKFLRKRNREISLKDARRVIKDKVLPMLSEINDDIIRNKEDHVTHIKALRQQSVFQKGDLENFRNENIELKKDILELRSQIKMLKVEIGKARALGTASHPLNRQICTANKKIELQENALKTYQEFQQPNYTVTSTGESNGFAGESSNQQLTFQKKKQQSVTSGSTRASSTNPFEEPEYLKQQANELKLKLTQQEERFKLKMGRMKSFYDATLKKLNSKSNPGNPNSIG